MRRIWVVSFSFLLAFEPTVFALTKPQQNQVKDFVEATGIGREEVTLKEYFNRIKTNLPEELRAQLQTIVDANPELRMPKVSVTKVGPVDQEDIQVSFVTKGNQSASFIIKGQDKVLMQLGQVTISQDEITDVTKLEEKFSEASPVGKSKLNYKTSAFGLLSARDVNLLTLSEKRVYFKKLRELMGSMEKLENSVYGFNSDADKTAEQRQIESSFSYFLSNIISSAEAASYNDEAVKNIGINQDKNSCIYAGYVTNYGYKIDNGSYSEKRDKKRFHYACGGPESSFDSRKDSLKCQFNSKPGIKCNPDIYGASPGVCAPEHSANATAICNSQSDKYDAFPKQDFKDKGATDFDNLKKEVVAKLVEQKSACQAILVDKKDRLEDQKATCEELNLRIKEIEETTCQMASGEDAKADAGKKIDQIKRQDKFKDLKCIKVQNPVPPGQPPVVVLPAPQVPPQAPAKPEDCASGKFNKDPSYIQAVQADCSKSSGTVGTCVDVTKTQWVNCSCPAGTTARNHTVGLPYFCEGGVSKTAPGGPGKTSTSSSSASFNWKPWIPLAVGLFAVGVGYWLTKDKMKTQYNQWTPSPTATPVPSTTATPVTRGAR